jgi:hypothetical protein
MTGSVMYSEGRLSTCFCHDFSQTLHFPLTEWPTLTGDGLVNKWNSCEFLWRVGMIVCFELGRSCHYWIFKVTNSRNQRGSSIANDSDLYSRRAFFVNQADTKYPDVTQHLHENSGTLSCIRSILLSSTLFSIRQSLSSNLLDAA